MIVVFTVLYFIRGFGSNTIKYRFDSASLEMTQSEDYGAIYTGKVRLGQKACFTVSPDRTVLFQIDQDTYGPFHVAVNNRRTYEFLNRGDVNPLNIYVGDKIVFNGGYSKKLGKVYLKVEEYPGFEADSFQTDDGTEFYVLDDDDLYFDKDYNIRTYYYGSTAPSVSDLVKLSEGLPQIEDDHARSKKVPICFFLGVLYSLCSAYGIYAGKRWTNKLTQCVLRGLAFFLIGLL